MDEDQNDLLIRVDQNVINLIKTLDQHILDDKEFQKIAWAQFKQASDDRFERKGGLKVAGVVYGVFASLIGAVIGIRYGK